MRLLSVLLLAPQLALGHSWIEQLVNVDSQGKYVGEFGYERNFTDKSTPGFNQDQGQWLINEGSPVLDSSRFLCPPQQRKATQNKTGAFPRLKTTPGNWIAMRYAENGHVSQPDQLRGKPEKGGTVFVYGTTQPKEDEKAMDVLQWTKDGSGGDKRGVLLATNNFDDGRCYEMSTEQIAVTRQQKTPVWALGQGPQVQKGSANTKGNYPLFCETNVAMPKDAKTGAPYTLYWVWQWNTKVGTDGAPKGKDEYYSSCIDVDMVDTIKQDFNQQPNKKFKLLAQDDMDHALKDFKSRTALVTDPFKLAIAPIVSSGNNTDKSPSGGPAQPPAPTGAPVPPTGNPKAPSGFQTQVSRSGAVAPSAPAQNPPAVSVKTEIQTVVMTVTVTAGAPTPTIKARDLAEHGGAHGSAKYRPRRNSA